MHGQQNIKINNVSAQSTFSTMESVI